MQFGGVGTHTEMAAETDINVMMRRYQNTGVISVSAREARYGDFSTASDFLGSMVAVREAERDFNALPSKIRSRFKNEVSELLDFLADPANEAEAQEMGLIPSEKDPAQPVPSGTEGAPDAEEPSLPIEPEA